MKIVAVIPVKEHSERVPNKNIRKFYNTMSLLDILITKLKKCKEISKIYISSNSKKINNISKKNKCFYLERDLRYCNNVTSWSEVIFEVVNNIPENENTVLMWCHTTTPIFDSYKNAISIYKNKKFKNDGLISVEKYKRFLISEKKKPINYSWGIWHPYSQDIDSVFSVTGALFMMKIKDFKKNRYVISKNPYFLETKNLEGIDIDTKDDFKLAQLLYRNKSKL